MLPGITANASPIYQDQQGIILPEADAVGYHFATDFGAFNDTPGGTLADNNDTIAVWQNQGTEEENAIQSNPLLRPRFRAGGLNNKPYIEGLRPVPAYFENLQGMSVGAGILTWSEWTSFAFVVDNLSDTEFCGFLGGGSKNNIYFRPVAGEAVQFEKGDFRFGTISGPTVVVMTKTSNTTVTAYFNGNRTFESDASNPPSLGSSSEPFLRSSFLPEADDQHFSGHLYEFISWRNFQRLTEPQMVELSSRLMTKYNIS